ncbi:MAG TPA: hypothetical protein VN429_10695 [Methanospirillum sp.]|uniref:hypothetical protein n=1 Tax=Methanospirillum sp. TaxID=45200 RepID=UPI002B67A066|nr:hypothetical protein [Methanospirillum sp.]HWQ64874.1 hypothetical protein [Methanospirillum sp.]
MKQERIFGILLILLAFGVILAGCTSHSQEKQASAHAAIQTGQTAVPEVTISHPSENTTNNGSILPLQSGLAGDLTHVAGNITYNEGGVIFSYPDRFKQISNSSLEKMRTVAGQGGINILTILTATDSKDSIQVTWQNTDATLDGLYNEKMTLSHEVAINGSVNVSAMTFVRFDVEGAKFADGTGVIKVTAVNSENGAAVTYLFCRPGLVYNINFVYANYERAENEALVRDGILSTLSLK